MAKALKDLYSTVYIELLAQRIAENYQNFCKKEFIKDILDDSWSKKALKSRMRHISLAMGKHLPSEYEAALDILQRVFAQMPDEYNLQNMIFQDFVEVYGLEHFDASMRALEYFTITSSCEFAIRQFILRYPEATMNQMMIWAKSPHLDVRRLASEGCRPRLPWACDIPFFKKNPKKVLELLKLLRDDQSTYVRTSVANNLSDISKDNPMIFKKTIKMWLGANNARDKMLEKACNYLMKKADRDIFELFGYKSIAVSIVDFSVSQSLHIGEELFFSFVLCSHKAFEKVRVEYAISFARKSSTHYSKKFIIYDGAIKDSNKKFEKKYSFKPIRTRKYYAGEHKISVIVNGQEIAQKEFLLI